MQKRFKILDISSLVPGPMAANMLSQYGCEILKIESALNPDPLSIFGLSSKNDKKSGKAIIKYSSVNYGKNKLSLDFTGVDREKFNELLKESDAVVISSREKSLKKLFLDEQSLHSINPKLCILYISGYPTVPVFGKDMSNYPAHDLSIQAASGWLYTNGDVETYFADIACASEGARELWGALNKVLSTGKGQVVRVNMLDSVVKLTIPFLSATEFDCTITNTMNPRTFALLSKEYDCWVPSYGVYTAKCGRKIAMAGLEPKFYLSFLNVLGLGNEKWLIDARLCFPDDSIDLHKKACSYIQKKIKSKSWQEWEPLFDESDRNGRECCVELVRTPKEAADGMPHLSFLDLKGNGRTFIQYMPPAKY